MIKAVIAVSVGAAVGAMPRWVLGIKLNATLAVLPFGTLVANLLTKPM